MDNPETAMKPTVMKPSISGKNAPHVIMETDPSPDAEERLEWIATAAYYKAEARGFVPGLEMEDWLEAEIDYEEREEP